MSDSPYLPERGGEDDYFGYVRPIRRGLVEPLVNGRSSGGSGPDEDLTEPLDAMQKEVAALGEGDAVYLAAWFFEPATKLTNGDYGSATTWGELFAAKAEEGVMIRLLINDFDAISGMDSWLERDGVGPLDKVIAGISPGCRDNFQYVLSLHPAHVGALKSMLAGQGGRDIYVASHHQKFMIVRKGREMVAFCGGLDLESRKTPGRWSYDGLIGWHDVHVRLEGPITRDLECEFVLRWNRERGSSRRGPVSGWSELEALTPTPLSDEDDVPEKKRHQVQMLRTVSTDATLSPYSTERDDVKQAYQRGIGCARRYIYLENQYFRSRELAEWIVAQAQGEADLVVIMVVVASAAADDGTNAITEHGDFLQYDTFEKIVTGVGKDRVRLYTMKHRAVHSKLIMADDHWMCVGSANANVRSFELDTELNIQTTESSVISAFRHRLWAHDLGLTASEVEAWDPDAFLARWDEVAAANAELEDAEMGGEGVLAFDYTSVKGEKHGSVPDALAELDVAPEGGIFAGVVGGGEGTIKVG